MDWNCCSQSAWMLSGDSSLGEHRGKDGVVAGPQSVVLSRFLDDLGQVIGPERFAGQACRQDRLQLGLALGVLGRLGRDLGEIIGSLRVGLDLEGQLERGIGLIGCLVCRDSRSNASAARMSAVSGSLGATSA